MDELIKKRGRVKAKLTRVCNFIDQVDLSTVAVSDITVRLEMMSEIWTEFDNIQSRIEISSESNDLALHENEQEEFENRFISTKAKLLKLRDALASSSELSISNRAPSTLSQVKLPVIELPTFAGDYQQWSSFSDLFTSVIHNNVALSSVQKLHYLKSAVRGEAGRLLNSITTTEANYSEAWNILKDRYSNKKQIVHAHLKTLHAQPKLTSDSVSDLRRLLDTTVENIRALHALGLPTDQWDCLLVFLVTDRLDGNTRRHWEIATADQEDTTFNQLKEFIEKRCRAVETTTTLENQKAAVGPSAKFVKGSLPARQTPSALTHHASTYSCVKCKANHLLYKCDQFRELSVQQRIELVKNNALCFNCLRNGHSSRQCNWSLCRKCNKSHNTLLHFESPAVVANQHTATVSSHYINDRTEYSQVLLATAIVYIQDSMGQKQTCRALLDSGSQVSFITEACLNNLGLKRQRVCINLSGVGLSGAGISKGIVCLNLSSTTSHFTCKIQALILQRITGKLPNSTIDTASWTHCQGIILADPTCHQPGNIDLLIGADILPQISLDGKIIGIKTSPTALNTTLGWILTGPVKTWQHDQSFQVCHLSIDIDISDQLKRFWEVEEVQCQHTYTKEESECERVFEETHSRDAIGRYIVRLPFKNNTSCLGSTRHIALNRLLQTERRFSYNLEQQQQYKDFMTNYLELGHMEEVSSSELNTTMAYYLPHHSVVKDTSSTTKLHVVFDGSARPSSGVSLNELLMVGPTIQDDLLNIVLRFRMHKIAFTADITQMYRQILVNAADCDFQRILWRFSSEEPVREYRLKTVTYGTATAPFLATRCLHQLAQDEQHNYPLGSIILKRDFYVDDLMSGADSVTNAQQLQGQLIKLLSAGGFELRKWASNCSILIDSLPEHLRDSQPISDLASDGVVRTLGLIWHPTTDHFSFRVSIPTQPAMVTKRVILSETSRLFDPFGWVSPVVIRAKLVIQELWLQGSTWDENLPPDITNMWNQYREELPLIEAIKIQRCITGSQDKPYQLHGFCDASEKAYGAVIFLRAGTTTNGVSVSLVCAKSRVAPLKKISLPRLELCGALLLSRLLSRVMQTLSIDNGQIYAWTDSTIVLAWLRGNPCQWKTFVANRISEIQELISPEQWRHVNSKDNSADCLSRGLSPSEILNFNLWWSGPAWLMLDPSCWPASKRTQEDQITSKVSVEAKKNVSTFTAIAHEHFLVDKYSSLSTLLRVSAWCIRFSRNCAQPQGDRMTGSLSTRELQDSLFIWIRQAQDTVFRNEIENCLKGVSLSRRSPLLSLHPFVDSTRILRVGGRLQEANIHYNRKHPIILPHHHPLTNLIINQEHIRQLHAGAQLLLASLQERYWILGARRAVRHHIHKCIKCFRQRVKTSQQLMGNLPLSRLEPARAFIRCGVDYAGPISIRLSRGAGRIKSHKSYICLFVCFVTKAIHLELINDLTTESFIAALRRFSSRRGKPSDIYSDCGTNFVGANRKLHELYELINSATHNEKLSHTLTAEGTNWHFSPPASPHFGGLWEAGVKSVKFHLRRTIGDALLTYEEMYTVLTQVEACLNSRPLCQLSSDPNDLSVLTPGHFLIGSTLTSIPDPDLDHLRLNRLSRWQLVQRIFRHFWRRWSTDYLSRLQQRPKWLSVQRNLAIGDLVLLKDREVSPFNWPLARVISTYPGKDNLVRVVDVKTVNGTLKRTIGKCCLLPIDDEQL